MTAQPNTTRATSGARQRTHDGDPSAVRTDAGVDAAFVAASTLTLVGIGALQSAGALPGLVAGEASALVGFYASLPGWAQPAFGAWQATATLLGLVLPGAAVLRWGRRGEEGRAVRRALAPLALVLLWQVLLEAGLARAFFPDIVVLIGMVFTAYRIHQLRRSRRDFSAAPPARELPVRARRTVSGLLAAGLVFWPLNLAFLLTTQLPRVLDL